MIPFSVRQHSQELQHQFQFQNQTSSSIQLSQELQNQNSSSIQQSPELQLQFQNQHEMFQQFMLFQQMMSQQQPTKYSNHAVIENKVSQFDSTSSSLHSRTISENSNVYYTPPDCKSTLKGSANLGNCNSPQVTAMQVSRRYSIRSIKIYN